MLINTIDKNIDLNFIADEIDEDIRFMVLDFTSQPELDYFYTPLVFLESFNAPCAILEIGKYNLEVPLDWNVIIADQFLGQSEIISIMQIADRGFDAFAIKVTPLMRGTQKTYKKLGGLVVDMFKPIRYN